MGKDPQGLQRGSTLEVPVRDFGVGGVEDAELRPVYALVGEQTVLVDEALARIRGAALATTLDAGAVDFNFDRFRGTSASAGQVLDAARTLPVSARRRLVVVKEADALLGSAGTSTDALLEYVESPAPQAVLVLVFRQLDARTRLARALEKRGAIVRCEPPSLRDMAEELRRRAAAEGLELEPQALELLAGTVGRNLGAAREALTRIALYAGAEPGAGPEKSSRLRRITAADVEAVVAEARVHSVFTFVDDVGRKDRAAALTALHGMLVNSREPALRVLAMVARHYRQLLRARILSDRRTPKAEIAAAGQIPPFLVDRIVEQARRQSPARLADCLRAVSSTDQALKSAAANDLRLMERLVLELCRGADAR